MKILLFGKDGQLGWELQRSLGVLGHLIALGRQDAGQLCGNLENPEAIRKTIELIRPDIIVNAAAYTHVDKAEGENEQAYLINAKAPEVMAQVARKLNAWLIHYSTDYVFNGHGNVPWRETDVTEPLNVYGLSKRAGEDAIIASGCNYLVFRTSWVYATRGSNFIKTILRLAQERTHLKIVDDQIGSPTSAELLADITAHVLFQLPQNISNLSGVYHVTANGETSWYGFARYILQQVEKMGVACKATSADLSPIPSSDYPTPARRPLNSRLDTTLFKNTFHLNLPDWQTGVTRMLAESFQENR